MLLDKPIAKNDIITIKLSTGEEIIAKYVEDTDASLVVERATTMAANPQGGLGLVPWMMSAMPEKISLNRASVLAYAPTVKEIADKFVEATTGITLAP
tara:strand:+ start:165 stop:458 length:294 start_codon:yes stop_codon:yes gene_type:complete